MLIYSRCSLAFIGRIGKDIVAILIYYLRGPILDSSDLVEVVPAFYIAFTLEDIPFYLTSILCL
jgi:hypothetical protein